MTESMAVSWRGDPGNGDASNADYGTFVSRLNAQASWGDWLLAARLDSAAFASVPLLGDRISKPTTPDVPGRPVNSADLEGRFVQALVDPRKGLEKLTLRYGGRGLEVTLGDFYANFGRGLVLSLRKVDELGLDTTILGGKLALRSGPLTTTVLAGVTNIQNLDETTSRYSPDPDDALAAARVEYRLPGNAQLGVHGLYGRPSQQRLISATTPDEVRRAGVSLEMPRPLPGLSLYGEYALRADHEADAEHPGHAFYTSATGTSGPLSVVFEGKAYLGYQPWKATNNAGIKNLLNVVYMAPPTLERIITPLSNNTDIVAGRLRLDYAAGPALSGYAAYELGEIFPNASERYVLHDGYAGGQLRWSSGRGHLFPLLGWREERDKATGELAERIVAFEGDATQPIVGSWSVESQWLVWERYKPANGEWLEGQAYLALKNAPGLVMAVGYEFTTALMESSNQHDFVNGTVQWNITPSTSLKLFAGGQRAGLKCVSGLCRIYPAFNGVRLELVGRL